MCRARLLRACLLSTFALLAAASLAAQPLSSSSRTTADASLPDNVVHAAMAYLGVPYVHGGDSREGLDCSGLVHRVFQETARLDLPRGVDSLFHAGTPVLRPLHIGDLLFFDTTEDAVPSVPAHVGVYIGADRFVHAASAGSKTGVIVSSLRYPYYRARFLRARRVISWRAPILPMTLTDDHTSLILADPFPSRETVTINVYNAMSGGGPMDLTLFKDGHEVLTRRIVPGAQKPSEIALAPDIGQWTVRVTRLFKGRELQRVAFRVEE